MALWTPADLGAPLKLWLAGNLNDDQTAGAKTVWTDASGNGNDCAAGNDASTDPELVLAELNGLPVFRFNGLNYFDSEGSIDITGDQFSVAFVVKTSVNQDDYWTGRDPTDKAFSQRTGGGLRTITTFDDGDNEHTLRYANGPDDANWHIHVEIFNRTSSVGSLDGTAANTGTFPEEDGDMTGATIANGVTLGWDLGLAANSLTGDIAEMAFIDGALAAGDRQKWEGFLAHKYALTDNLPALHPYKSAAPEAGSTIRSRIIGSFY